MTQKKEKGSGSTNWIDLLAYVIEGNKKKFLIAFFLTLLANGFITLANPLALKYLFDEGIIRGDFRLFVIMAIFFIVVFTGWRIWVYFNRLYIQKLKISVTKRISQRMITKYYQIPYGEMIKKDQGYYVSRVYDEVTSAAQPTIDSFLSLFASIISLVLGVGVVLAMSWRASLTIIFALPLIFLVSRRYGEKIKNLSKVEKEKEASLKGVLTRSVSSFKLANVYGLTAKVLDKVSDAFNDFAEAYTKRFRNSTRYETLNGTLMSYAETLAIIGAGYEMLVGRMSFGGYMAFMGAYWTVIGSVQGLFSLVPEISRLVGSVERLKEFEELELRERNIKFSDEIVLSNLNFAYDNKNIIEAMNLRALPGERVLVVGPNGSGKSSFAHLVAGLLEPQSGELTTFPMSKVSAVIQPLEFVPGSVLDNLSFADSEAQKDRYKKLAKEFGIEQYLDKDPLELSTGQRKKLEIIMGLTKEAEVYVFDEPLAGIDVDSKESVMSKIIEHTHNKIVFVIMHGDERFHEFFDRKIDIAANKSFELHNTPPKLKYSKTAV